MTPLQLFDAASSTFTYVLFDPQTREALIIDPVDQQLQRDLGVLREYGLTLVWTLETHTHADHITSAARLAEHTGAKTAVPAGCDIPTAAMQLHDGDFLRFGAQQLKALHTPGHTAGSMSYLWQSEDEEGDGPSHVFTGDTLLINGCGRTDFQSGSADALYTSITEKLFSLPDDTVVWPAHDYQGRSHSTLGAEKTLNPRIAGKSREDFIKLMGELDLPPPARLAEAVAANRASGLVDSHQRQDADSSLRVRPAEGYAGDVTPALAFQWTQSGEAVLVDVRTDAEREWVGFVPGAVPVAWKQWPGMAMNAGFDDAIRAAVPAGQKVVLLCRSGVRSVAAARRATELGLEAYNILQGFEGDADENGQRGKRGGWRLQGLPWKQG